MHYKIVGFASLCIMEVIVSNSFLKLGREKYMQLK
jgi:hypothetical protein